MYLIKLGLLQSGTGQSEFIGNFLRGGGQGIKQKDKHNHLSKQFVCAASSCYGLSTTLLWSVPWQICHLGTQLQSNETICLSKYTCRPKTVHLLLMNKFQKTCTLCENCEPKEGQIE